jgi:transcriptional regulator of acetoin/glycerol metabolism
MGTSTRRETEGRRNLLAFRAALNEGWTMEEVCRQLGISRATYYRRLEETGAETQSRDRPSASK